VGPIVNGQAEIAGMSTELLETFSKRSSQVDVALAAKLEEFRDREGRDPTRWERGALTREASADTRGHKTGNGVTDLQTRWTAEAAGYCPTSTSATNTIGPRRPSVGAGSSLQGAFDEQRHHDPHDD